MLKSGLVSITFRNLAPRQIISLAKRSLLSGIEWGGDLHIPPGDYARAQQVGKETVAAGLDIIAYGSYYRVGVEEEQNNPGFDMILRTALHLGARIIRVWAWNKSPHRVSGEAYRQVISESRRIADKAGQENIKIAFEYHANTLTETNHSARKLLIDIDHPNIYSFWQPPLNRSRRYCRQGIKNLLRLGKLLSLHVFHWNKGWQDRCPLQCGEKRWLSYLKCLSPTREVRYLCLEFVKDDEPRNLLKDAATLNRWLGVLS